MVGEFMTYQEWMLDNPDLAQELELEPCPDCDGVGEIEGEICEFCDGSGVLDNLEDLYKDLPPEDEIALDVLIESMME